MYSTDRPVKVTWKTLHTSRHNKPFKLLKEKCWRHTFTGLAGKKTQSAAAAAAACYSPLGGTVDPSLLMNRWPQSWKERGGVKKEGNEGSKCMQAEKPGERKRKAFQQPQSTTDPLLHHPPVPSSPCCCCTTPPPLNSPHLPSLKHTLQTPNWTNSNSLSLQTHLLV